MRNARGKGQRDDMQTFGASAPLKSLLTKYGFTGEKVVAAARAQLAVAQS
jgi:transketolase